MPSARNHPPMEVDRSPGGSSFSSRGNFNRIGMIAAHIIEWFINHANHKFEVIVWQITAADHKIDVGKSLRKLRTVYIA